MTNKRTMTKGKQERENMEAEVKSPKSKEKVEKPVRVPVKFAHKTVIKKLSENVGKGKLPSLSGAAREMGYSDSYAHSGRMTKTKSWKALLEQYLPEDRLLRVHDQQLNSYKLQSMTFQKQIDDEVIYELIEGVNSVVKKIVEIPIGKVVFYITSDNQSRNKALEMGLKLHKKLTDKVEVKDTTPFTQLSDAELAERIKKGKNFFLKK